MVVILPGHDPGLLRALAHVAARLMVVVHDEPRLNLKVALPKPVDLTASCLPPAKPVTHEIPAAGPPLPPPFRRVTCAAAEHLRQVLLPIWKPGWRGRARDETLVSL